MNENLLTIEELCKELGIGRSKAYQLLNAEGKITIIFSYPIMIDSGKIHQSVPKPWVKF